MQVWKEQPCPAGPGLGASIPAKDTKHARFMGEKHNTHNGGWGLVLGGFP